jgi:hypothetical protein
VNALCLHCREEIDGAYQLIERVAASVPASIRIKFPEGPIWGFVCRRCLPQYFEVLSYISGWHRNPPDVDFLAVFNDNTQVAIKLEHFEPPTMLVSGPGWGVRLLRCPN